MSSHRDGETKGPRNKSDRKASQFQTETKSPQDSHSNLSRFWSNVVARSQQRSSSSITPLGQLAPSRQQQPNTQYVQFAQRGGEDRMRNLVFPFEQQDRQGRRPPADLIGSSSALVNSLMPDLLSSPNNESFRFSNALLQRQQGENFTIGESSSNHSSLRTVIEHEEVRLPGIETLGNPLWHRCTGRIGAGLETKRTTTLRISKEAERYNRPGKKSKFSGADSDSCSSPPIASHLRSLTEFNSAPVLEENKGGSVDCEVGESIAENSGGSFSVPCKARGMPLDHTAKVCSSFQIRSQSIVLGKWCLRSELTLLLLSSKTAFIVIPAGAVHGESLTCSYKACRDGGIKFRYCAVCKKPVTKRNFRQRHTHAGELGLGDCDDDQPEKDDVKNLSTIYPSDAGETASLSNTSNKFKLRQNHGSNSDFRLSGIQQKDANMNSLRKNPTPRARERAKRLRRVNRWKENRKSAPPTSSEVCPGTKLPPLAVKGDDQELVRSRSFGLLHGGARKLKDIGVYHEEVPRAISSIPTNKRIFSSSTQASEMSEEAGCESFSQFRQKLWDKLLLSRPPTRNDSSMHAWLHNILMVSDIDVADAFLHEM